MANLERLQQFAEENDFGLTSPLRHGQVVRLARHWFPELRFFETERFHPISLGQDFSMIDDLFSSLPQAEQEELLVDRFVRTGQFTGTLRSFEPPIVELPDGVVAQPTVSVVRVIGEGSLAVEALDDAEVGTGAVVTRGASFARANRFFGPIATVDGSDVASAGNPFLPRATNANGRPLITVLSSLQNLIELLKYELLVSATFDDDDPDNDYPPDAMRGEFNIARSLVHSTVALPNPLPFSTLRQFLLDLIRFEESGGQAPTLPSGWELDRSAWNVVRSFAFLEYDFFYAYNDFKQHEAALFANEHEADNEGCCLVFDRKELSAAATSGNARDLLRVVPRAIITSVHEEDQDADQFKFIARPNPFPPDALGRDVVPFTAYPAAGSHATYLTPGLHDLVDFQDYTAKIQENPAVLLIAPGLVVAVLIILAIIEHFTDTEDETSDDGIRTGPADVVGAHPNAVANQLVVIPMSKGNHIYEPGNEDLLRLRAYAGKWGGHDGIIDKSPAFKPKTARYFHRLLSKA